LPQPIERQDFHKRLQDAGGRKAVERWTMKRLQQEQSISATLQHNSEVSLTKYGMISAAEISFWPWPTGSSGLRHGCSSRQSTEAMTLRQQKPAVPRPRLAR
jgi:hypothetical protein